MDSRIVGIAFLFVLLGVFFWAVAPSYSDTHKRWFGEPLGPRALLAIRVSALVFLAALFAVAVQSLLRR